MSQFSLSVLKYRVWTMNYLYLFIYKVLSIYGISSKNISTLVGCSWWTSDRKVAGRIPAPLGWNWATCRSILEQGTEPQNCSWCAVATCVAATAISKGPGMSWRLIQGVPWPSPTVTGFGTVTPPIHFQIHLIHPQASTGLNHMDGESAMFIQQWKISV